MEVTPDVTPTELPPRPSVPYTPVPADTLSPSVIQRAPLRGETLAPDGAIELVFDREMDQQTAAGAFKVLAAGKDTPVIGRGLLDRQAYIALPARRIPGPGNGL